jgi:hypothetical protein
MWTVQGCHVATWRQNTLRSNRQRHHSDGEAGEPQSERGRVGGQVLVEQPGAGDKHVAAADQVRGRHDH